MKIIIHKKHLGSLSSLLILSFSQPSAHADPHVSTRPLQSSFETKIFEDDKQNLLKVTSLPASCLKIRINQTLQHNAYKAGISHVFSSYHKALEALEERYQDKVDDVLDHYEENIRLAEIEQSKPEDKIKQAKQNAAYLLADLKEKHYINQTALKQKYHIS